MPLPPEPLTCHLCGSDDPRNEVIPRAVAWKVADADGNMWATVARCRDSQLCRNRAETAGDTWPAKDQTVPLPKPADLIDSGETGAILIDFVERPLEEAPAPPITSEAPPEGDLLEEAPPWY